MKFKRLRIHNIASIEDAEIDFQNGVLADEPLFLITGPTGSGKTTILDAICLALYGETPRMLKTEARVHITDRYNASKKSDTEFVVGETEMPVNHKGQLLRRGSAEGWSELDFETNDGKEYRARWYVSRAYKKSDGKLKNPDNSIEDLHTHEVTQKNAKELIASIVGLSFDEFCRTTMLAQGEFTKFIQSSSKEKSEILERLTGTQQYSEISKKIAAICSEKRTEYERLKVIAGSIPVLSDEQLAEKKATLRQYEEEGKLVDNDIEILTSQHNWLAQKQLFDHDIQEHQRLILEGENVMDQPAYKEKSQLIADYAATAQPRAWLAEMKTAQGKVNQLKASLPENYQEYLILRHAKTILCRRHEADLQTLGSLKAWLEGQQTFAAMYGEAKAIIEKLRHIIENEKSVVLKAKTMDEHQALLPKEEETWQNCKKEEQHLAEQLAPLLKELTQLEKTREDMHPQGLHDDYNRLNQAILDNDKASATLQLLETVRLQHADAEKEYKALLDEHERLEHNAKNLDENLQTAQRQYDIAKDIYDKWHRSLDDSFKMLRASLRKGDTCPLCMNEVTHDHVPDPDFESVIRPVVEQRDAADKVLKEALASQQTNNKLIVDAERKMPLAKRKWERSLNDLEKQHADTVDVLGKAGVYVGEQVIAGQANIELEKKKSVLESSLENIKQKLLALENLNEKIKGYYHSKALLAESVSKAHDATLAAEQRISNHKTFILSLQEQVKEMERSNSATLLELDKVVSYDDWHTLWEDSHQTFISRLEQEAATYGQQQNILQTLIRQTDMRQMTLDVIQQTEKQIIPILSPLPSGEVPDDFEYSENTDDIESLSVSQQRWSSFANRLTAWKSELAANTEISENKRKQIDTFLSAQESMSMQRLIQLSEVEEEEISRVMGEHKATEDLLTQRKGVLENLQRQLSSHLSSRPEMEDDMTIESLAAAIEKKKTAKNQLLLSLGQLRHEIDEDKNRRIQAAEAIKACKSSQEEKERWERFNKEFGSVDGTRFSRIAQSFILAHLLRYANKYLRQFSDRYELVCEPGELTILVRDRFCNQSPQFVKVISGGESFMVSLSMALALSQLNVNQANIDTLFIDEGFGSLDEDCLNAVMDTLEKLHQMGGRRVGVISHVEALNERIRTQIQVRRIDPVRSQVKVVKF